MKGKALFISIISLLLMSCESKITPVLNFYQAEMHVGDSLLLTITGAPIEDHVWVLTPYHKSVLKVNQTSDTSAMIYAQKVGEELVQVQYSKHVGPYVDSRADILVPVTVVEP